MPTIGPHARSPLRRSARAALLGTIALSLLPLGVRAQGSSGGADPATSGSAVLTAQADGTVARPYLDLEEGKTAARAAKKPLLVLFRAPTCAYSQLFFERTALDPAAASTLAGLVFTSIDAADGKGKFLAKMHEVTVTPTFVLYDPDRGPLHQWKGWGLSAFLLNLGGGLRANTPVVERLARYETAPTADDATLLGFFHASTANYAASLAEFVRAEQLDPNLDFAAEKFDAAAGGYFAAQVSLDDLRSAADGVVAKTSSADEAINIASIMARVTERAGTGGHVAPYLRTALERSAGSTDPEILGAIERLEPYRLLYLENDPNAALARYQQTFAGWPTDPNALNDVAWWCLAHGIHLSEAEGWARGAIDGYTNPVDRANARDTLADLLLRRGEKQEAIEQLTKAFEEAPQITAYGLKLRDLGADVNVSGDGNPGGAAGEGTPR